MVTFEPLLERVKALVDAGRLPGVQLRVTRQGEIEVEAAIGTLSPADGRPLVDDAIFRIYSMTKPITSVALMMLVEAGDIGLDQPITQWFGEFANLKVGVERQDASGARHLDLVATERVITVRDLMRHTAGFTYGWGATLVQQRYRELGCDRTNITSDELIKRLGEAPLAYQPGTTWEYGCATDVLGVLVERVAGCSLAEFFDERIFAPLGMIDTGFSVVPEKAHRVAQPFEVDPDLATPIKLRRSDTNTGYFSGGGGLFSTLADYQRFVDLLVGRGTLEGIRLLSPSSIDRMTRDHLGQLAHAPDYLPGPDCGFGLGFAVRKKDGPLGHAGDYFWSGMAGTFFWVDPSMDLNAIWLMQAPNQRDEMRTLFRELVYQSYQG
jgi:CubicO group peptidase (beta-lactamase class C family)